MREPPGQLTGGHPPAPGIKNLEDVPADSMVQGGEQRVEVIKLG